MQEENSELATVPGNSEQFSRVSSLVSSNGGADGIRTHDLLDAIEARSQLRHGPTGGTSRSLPQIGERLEGQASAGNARSIAESALAGREQRGSGNDVAGFSSRGWQG